LLNVFLPLLLTSKIPFAPESVVRSRTTPRPTRSPELAIETMAKSPLSGKWPVLSSRLSRRCTVQPHKFGQPDNLSAVVGAIDPTGSDDAIAKNVGPGWSRWHLPWRLAAPRRSFRYKLEAPVEAVIEQESSAAVNVKVIPIRRVVHGRPDPTELLAQSN